jgi:hypothetical protein
MKIQGDAIRAFGEPTENAVAFGQEVISLECGHRLHRSCLIEWLNFAQAPTCPMCRGLTEWEPDVGEERSISRMLLQSWKSLGQKEHSFIKIVWFVALLVALTDPLAFSILTTFLFAVLPRIFLPQAVVAVAFFKMYFVSKEPGIRMSMAFAVASLLSVVAITNHEMRREVG